MTDSDSPREELTDSGAVRDNLTRLEIEASPVAVLIAQLLRETALEEPDQVGDRHATAA